MWNRFHWLSVRVKVQGKRGVNVWIPPLSLHVARSAVLSADGLLGLIGGTAGRTARKVSDLIQKSIAIMQDEGLDVDVKVKSQKEDVRVRIHIV